MSANMTMMIAFSIIFFFCLRDCQSFLVTNPPHHVVLKANSVRMAKIEKFGDTSKDAIRSRTENAVAMRELFTPLGVNDKLIQSTIVAETLLLNVALVLGSVTGTDVVNFQAISLDPNTLVLVAELTAIMTFGGLLFDRIPLKQIQTIHRDTQYFTLMLFGRTTKPAIAILFAALISTFAGVCEEIFFRGFVFTAISNTFNPETALVISSGIFGLAHFPVWGADAFIESILGGYLGYSYLYSGFNLAVPIIVHTLYDFFTLIITWNFAREDLTRRLQIATKEEVKALLSMDPKTFERLSRRIFEMLDLNGDGYIDLKELDLALKLTDLDQKYFGDYYEGSRRLFNQVDADKDGKINIQEFTTLLSLETALYGRSGGEGEEAAVEGKK